jgi:hypothetical protein
MFVFNHKADQDYSFFLISTPQPPKWGAIPRLKFNSGNGFKVPPWGDLGGFSLFLQIIAFDF